MTNGSGIEEIVVEIDAPDGFTAEADAVAMLHIGEGWTILTAGAAQEVVGT